MWTNRNSYLPFIIIIVAALLLALVGFISGLSEFNAAQQNETPEAPAAIAAESSGTGQTGDVRPVSPPLRNSSDTLTVALYGEMANGGYWRWDDIVNLLGVYGTAGQFQSTTISGTTYEGVPLSYLLRYAQLNSGTDRLTLRTRDGRDYVYAANNINDFAAYIISTTSNNTLVVVPPASLELNIIIGLASIQAERTAEETNSNTSVLDQDVPIPANPDALSLVGSIRRGGQWTWSDLNNLLDIYANGTPTTVTTSRGTFTGVPVPYLVEYAELENTRINLIFLYSRSGTEYTTTSGITVCAECIITQADNGSLTLVQPGSDPEVLLELAAIVIP